MTAIKNFMQREKPNTLENFCYQYFGVDESLLVFMNEDLKIFDDNQIIAIKNGLPIFAHESETSKYILQKYTDIQSHIAGFGQILKK